MKDLTIDSITSSDRSFPDYDKDFTFSKGFDFKGASFSKTRHPIEEFYYQNSCIFLYRLPIKSNKILPKILKIRHDEISPPSGYYELDDFSLSGRHISYEILYHTGKPDSGPEINFNFVDKNFKVLKNNDTTYACYLNLGSFSVNYNSSGIVDFYGEKESNANISLLPIEIFFEKKKNDHYYMFIVMQKGI